MLTIVDVIFFPYTSGRYRMYCKRLKHINFKNPYLDDILQRLTVKTPILICNDRDKILFSQLVYHNKGINSYSAPNCLEIDSSVSPCRYLWIRSYTRPIAAVDLCKMTPPEPDGSRSSSPSVSLVFWRVFNDRLRRWVLRSLLPLTGISGVVHVCKPRAREINIGETVKRLIKYYDDGFDRCERRQWNFEHTADRVTVYVIPPQCICFDQTRIQCYPTTVFDLTVRPV